MKDEVRELRMGERTTEGLVGRDKAFVFYPKFMENHQKVLKTRVTWLYLLYKTILLVVVLQGTRVKAGRTIIVVEQARHDGGLAWSGVSRLVRNGQVQVKV